MFKFYKFKHLPLTENEITELDEYYKMYELFINSEVPIEGAWLAVRNLFVMKNMNTLSKRLKSKYNV